MRTNGYLTYSLNGSNGKPEFDDSGLPILPTIEWSEQIPCFIQTINSSPDGQYTDGKFRQDSYRVLVEGQSFVNADRLNLTRNGLHLGEFGVKSVIPITLDRVEIITTYGYKNKDQEL